MCGMTARGMSSNECSLLCISQSHCRPMKSWRHLKAWMQWANLPPITICIVTWCDGVEERRPAYIYFVQDDHVGVNWPSLNCYSIPELLSTCLRSWMERLSKHGLTFDNSTNHRKYGNMQWDWVGGDGCWNFEIFVKFLPLCYNFFF